MEIKISSSAGYVMFVDNAEMIKRYNSCYNLEDIAYQHNTYMLKNSGMSGFYSLPENNSIWQTGLNQDGSDFYKNRYSTRLLTFDFKQIIGANLLALNRVLYQNDKLLDIQITTQNEIFSTRGSIIGTAENGNLELECEPFFRTSQYRIENFSLGVEDVSPLIPFMLPRVFFAASSGDDFTANITGVNLPIEPKITITTTTSIANPTIQVIYGGQVVTSLKINDVSSGFSIENGVVKNLATNEDITALCEGFLPSFGAGNNQIKIIPSIQIANIYLAVEFNVLSGGIY